MSSIFFVESALPQLGFPALCVCADEPVLLVLLRRALVLEHVAVAVRLQPHVRPLLVLLADQHLASVGLKFLRAVCVCNVLPSGRYQPVMGSPGPLVRTFPSQSESWWSKNWIQNENFYANFENFRRPQAFTAEICT